MAVVVTLLEVIFVAVAMDGAAAARGGVVVMGAVGMDGGGMAAVAGTVGGMAVVGMVVVRIGMAALRTGGGAIPTRMDTDPMVGKRR